MARPGTGRKAGRSQPRGSRVEPPEDVLRGASDAIREHRLRIDAEERRRSVAVGQLRDSGVTWDVIGELAGMTRSGAIQKWRAREVLRRVSR